MFAIWVVILVLPPPPGCSCWVFVAPDHTQWHPHTHPHSHSHSVGTLWIINWPIAENSTWQHTTFTRDRQTCSRRDSNSQFQHARSCKIKPKSARPQELSPSLYFMSINVENRMVYLCVEMNGSATFSRELDRLYLHFGFSYNFDFLEILCCKWIFFFSIKYRDFYLQFWKLVTQEYRFKKETCTAFKYNITSPTRFLCLELGGKNVHGVFYTLYKHSCPKTKNTLAKYLRIFIITALDEILLMYIVQCSNCDS
jgi:hypothetical protein